MHHATGWSWRLAAWHEAASRLLGTSQVGINPLTCSESHPVEAEPAMGSGGNNPRRVFLSHTSEFRNFPQGVSYISAVERAVSMAGHAIVDMVDFAAQDQEPAKVCEERVQASDLYVGIFGSRYGSPVRDRPEVSYTELEFDTATAAGIPRLVFLLDDEAENPGIPGKWLRDNTYGSRQEAFLKRVQDAGLTLSRFRNPDDLRACVYQALLEEAQRQRQNLDLIQKEAPNPSGWTWPGAWDFSGYLREKRKGFIGRRWLFDAVREWYSNTAGSQALLILADFGVGKSAFMAELAATGTAEQGLPIAANHFCDHNTAATLEAATFVRSVAAQLAGVLPAYKTAVEADPEARRWLEETQKDPASTFNQAVIGKLQGIAAPEAPLLLLVDGLDETLSGPSSASAGNGSSIVALLASGTSRLPTWLRVLATSRRRQEVRQPLEAAYSCDLLDAEEARNLSDIHDYVLGRCAVEPLAGRLAQASTSPAQLAARLADFEQSGGKFLYAVRVLNDRASPNGALRPDRLNDLPRGMEGFYLDAFRHRFPPGEDFEPMRALLGVLCAQREPLGRKELAAILSVGEAQALGVHQVQRLLARIEDFLRITNKLVAFDHLSLVQWLTEENNDGFPRAGVYAVQLEDAQERIGAWARAVVAAGRSHECPYLTRHLAAHLKPSERKEVFAPLLLDLGWLEARLRLADLNALLSDWQWIAPTPELSAVERALRQGAHVLSHQGPGWSGLEQLPSQLRARLPLVSASCEAHLAEPSLRDQALAQLQKAGGPRPLTASLLGSEALLRTFTGHESSVKALAVLPDGRLASGSDDATIKLWNPASGSCTATLEGHSSVVIALAVLPDGRLASGSMDRTIKLWDPANGEAGSSQLLFVADAAINALAFLPGVSILVAGDASGRLHWLQLGPP